MKFFIFIISLLLSSCANYVAVNGANINNLEATERKCRAFASYDPISIDKPVTYDTFVNCNENAGFVNCNATTYGSTSPELGLAEVVLNFAQLTVSENKFEQCMTDHGFILRTDAIDDFFINLNRDGGGWDPKNNE